jgi:hypothetical protein
MMFILQVSELPSIDLVRIIDGKVEGTSIDKLDSEQGQRAMGFMALLEKFQDKVCMPSPLLIPSVHHGPYSSPTCNLPSIRRRRAGSWYLGNTANFLT